MNAFVSSRCFPQSSVVRAVALRSVIALLVLGAGQMQAQVVRVGAVHDSIRGGGGRPLAGAEISILGTALRGRTDPSGRFALRDVPRGEFTVVVWTPWLDTLGIAFLHQRLDGSRADDTISLATPSLASLQLLHCGTRLAADEGILLGESRGADGGTVAGQIVWATWLDHRVEGVVVHSEQRAAMDTADAAGVYTLCGLPMHREVQLRAFGTTKSSGALSVEVTAEIQRIDLVVGASHERLEVLGRITQDSLGAPSARPVVGAEIRLNGDSTVSTRSDSIGGFRLQVPHRSGTIEIKAVGFAPSRAPVPLSLAPDSVWTIQISRPAQELSSVVVTAGPYAHERQGFEERRKAGIGRFITDEMLENLPVVTANALRSISPNIAVAGGITPRVTIRGSTTFGWCDPRIYEDGLDRGKMEDLSERVELAALIQRAKRIEIYTAALAPPKFTDNDGCGAIVIWTR